VKIVVSLPVRRNYNSIGTIYQYEYRRFEIQPVQLLRQPCGIGAASTRYHYAALFIPPDVALVEPGSLSLDGNGLASAPINRRLNPYFKAPREGWIKDVLFLHPQPDHTASTEFKVASVLEGDRKARSNDEEKRYILVLNGNTIYGCIMTIEEAREAAKLPTGGKIYRLTEVK
jgi:hypothetical protein